MGYKYPPDIGQSPKTPRGPAQTAQAGFSLQTPRRKSPRARGRMRARITSCATSGVPGSREGVAVRYGGLAHGGVRFLPQSHDTAFFQADLGNDIGADRETPLCTARGAATAGIPGGATGRDARTGVASCAAAGVVC